MKHATRILIVYAGLQGLIFALLMMAFDLMEDKPFDVSLFILRLLFFGAAMGLVDYFFAKKRAARKAAEEDNNDNIS
jgi:hypothetical protein